ncbi:MAG: diacylglycerol/lipid kinase family protein [Sediminibacterium sp.]|jgi:diacylglycerol kinase (ATP)
MEIKKVAILANTKAGKGKSKQISIWLQEQLVTKNILSTIHDTEWPTNNELAQYSDIWVIGGDGTINYFINKYPHCKIPIVLYSGGTGNDFAWKLYGNVNVKQQFENILNATPKLIDAAQVNDKLYINCLGVGFDGEILQSMKSIRWIGGHFGYLLAVIFKIFFFKSPTIKIQIDGESWHEKFLLALIVNSSRAGGGFFIAPTAEINDGLLNMVLSKNISIIKRLRYLPIIQKGQHLHLPFITHRLTKNITITCENELPIQIDGELIYAKNIEIKVLPKQFLFRY